MSLVDTLRELARTQLPTGTAARLHSLAEIARRDLPLARLAEAHFDAVSILREAGRQPKPGALYGVWASEIPGHAVTYNEGELFGKKRFCTGAGLLDRALVTATGPEPQLIDLDLRLNHARLVMDSSEWITPAFAETQTATVSFNAASFNDHEIIGTPRWYLERRGFWPGACAPAACWAGGALGLVDWARQQHRTDPHTLAHLGAMHASAWQLDAALNAAGNQIDAAPSDIPGNHILALTLRHVVEQAATDILTRVGRAYGPHPFAFDVPTSLRIAELQLYIRQSHAERDLEVLGQALRT